MPRKTRCVSVAPTRLAFADFGGNRQFVSAGNVSRDDRVSLFVMDYANRQRLKLLGHLRFEDIAGADLKLVSAVELPGYRARVERIATIEVEAFDWNCPQHITRVTRSSRSKPPRSRCTNASPRSRRRFARCGQLQRLDYHERIIAGAIHGNPRAATPTTG